MEAIKANELILIKELSSRKYENNSMSSKANEDEINGLKRVKIKLKQLASYFSEKYKNDYGPFETCVSSGNPIARGGRSLNVVWSGIFKGSSNKQYSAQISFVINCQNTCLDVGFYFGRASAHDLSEEERKEFEGQLRKLGINLSNSIINDKETFKRYNSLFDFGFRAYSNGSQQDSAEWSQKSIRFNAKSSQIVAHVFPNELGEIDSSTIDAFVAQAIFLMGGVDDIDPNKNATRCKPLTPEQWAKKAERYAQIGMKGELFAIEYERKRLIELGIDFHDYPRHIALESIDEGYDILSLDENLSEIYIEVKTTTRRKDDPNSRKFYISKNEVDFFRNNARSQVIYRVYDIEGSPIIEELTLDPTKMVPSIYEVNY